MLLNVYAALGGWVVFGVNMGSGILFNSRINAPDEWALSHATGHRRRHRWVKSINFATPTPHLALR